MNHGRKRRISPRALEHLCQADARLGQLIGALGPCQLRYGGGGSNFEALVRAIVYQQLSGKAAATIMSRVSELPGQGEALRADSLKACSDADLRGAGVSRQKLAAIRDLCARSLDGRLRLEALAELGDTELVEELTLVRGIGRWSAQMFMLFQLGRLDVWPSTDLGIRKAVARLEGHTELPRAASMRAYGQKFSPYGSVASWYLWRSLDSDAPPPS